MPFVRSDESITRILQNSWEIYGAEQLTVIFETKPEIIEHLLPPPLKPASAPYAAIFIADYPRTSFGLPYLESCLSVKASYNNEEGIFLVSMPVTDDMAMIYGHTCGYPKKMARIYLKRIGKEVTGWTERNGVRFLEIKATITGAYADPHAEEVISQFTKPPMDWVVYNFKHSPEPDRSGFEYNPRLVKLIVSLRPETIEVGDAAITLRASDYDPWADVEIVKIIGAFYTIGSNTMHPGKVVGEADPVQFLPYAYRWVDLQ